MLCAEHDHVERRGVQRQADHKDYGVADGEEDVFKIFIKFTKKTGVGVVGHVDPRKIHVVARTPGKKEIKTGLSDRICSSFNISMLRKQ